MNVLRVKSGVRFEIIAPAGARILSALDQATTVLGTDLVITCGTEGHPPDDPHSHGEAYDVSVAGIPASAVATLIGYVRARLGDAFYLQYETPPGPVDALLKSIAVVNAAATAPHIHVQKRKGTIYPPPHASTLSA